MNFRAIVASALIGGIAVGFAGADAKAGTITLTITSDTQPTLRSALAESPTPDGYVLGADFFINNVPIYINGIPSGTDTFTLL